MALSDFGELVGGLGLADRTTVDPRFAGDPNAPFTTPGPIPPSAQGRAGLQFGVFDRPGGGLFIAPRDVTVPQGVTLFPDEAAARAVVEAKIAADPEGEALAASPPTAAVPPPAAPAATPAAPQAAPALALAQSRAGQGTGNAGGLDGLQQLLLDGIRSGGAATPSDIDLIRRAAQSQLGIGGSEINRFAQQQLEQLREELAPSLGLRASDTPILDRGSRVAEEATRQQGQLARAIAGQAAEAQLRFPLERSTALSQQGLGLLGLNQQESQFGRALSQQESEFARALGLSDRQFRQAQLEFAQSQAQQAGQFGQTLGQQAGQFGQTLGQRQTEFGLGLAEQQRQFTGALTQQEAEFARQFGLSEQQFRELQAQFGQSLGQRQFEFGGTLGQREAEFARAFGLSEASTRTGLNLEQQHILENQLQFSQGLGQRQTEFDQTFGLSEALGRGSLNLEQQRLLEASRQFGLNFAGLGLQSGLSLEGAFGDFLGQAAGQPTNNFNFEGLFGQDQGSTKTTGGSLSNIFGNLGSIGNFLGAAKDTGLISGLSALSPSSRRFKESPDRAIDHEETLKAVEELPVEKWRYKKGISDEGEHIGPYAEDMLDAFKVGNEWMINHTDAIGIGLSATKGLAKKVRRLELKAAKEQDEVQGLGLIAA